VGEVGELGDASVDCRVCGDSRPRHVVMGANGDSDRARVFHPTIGVSRFEKRCRDSVSPRELIGDLKRIPENRLD
jgi:hypothetical protein